MAKFGPLVVLGSKRIPYAANKYESKYCSDLLKSQLFNPNQIINRILQIWTQNTVHLRFDTHIPNQISTISHKFEHCSSIIQLQGPNLNPLGTRVQILFLNH